MTDPRRSSRETGGRTVEVAAVLRVGPDVGAESRPGYSRCGSSDAVEAISTGEVHGAIGSVVVNCTSNLKARADRRTGLVTCDARDDTVHGPRSN